MAGEAAVAASTMQVVTCGWMRMLRPEDSVIDHAASIARDHDGGRLHVVASRSKQIHAYARDVNDPAKHLVKPAEIDLDGCLDNLDHFEWDEKSRVWNGIDPGFFTLFPYCLNIIPTAPYRMPRLRFAGGQAPARREGMARRYQRDHLGLERGRRPR